MRTQFSTFKARVSIYGYIEEAHAQVGIIQLNDIRIRDTVELNKQKHRNSLSTINERRRNIRVCARKAD